MCFCMPHTASTATVSLLAKHRGKQMPLGLGWQDQSAVLSTVAEKDKPSMLTDFPALVIFLFCVRNFAALQDTF